VSGPGEGAIVDHEDVSSERSSIIFIGSPVCIRVSENIEVWCATVGDRIMVRMLKIAEYMACGGHMCLGGIDKELRKFGDSEGDIRATVYGKVIEGSNDSLI
jgi:hypothetical protein